MLADRARRNDPLHTTDLGYAEKKMDTVCNEGPQAERIRERPLTVHDSPSESGRLPRLSREEQ